MKRMHLFFAAILFTFGISTTTPASDFQNDFLDRTLRIDYYHTGDSQSEIITLGRLRGYGIWAGGFNHMIDPFDNGRYFIKVYDAQSESMIYSRGFDSYFGEYRTSGPAAAGIQKTFLETALIPFPKNQVFFCLEKRDRQNLLQEIFRVRIDPGDPAVIQESMLDSSVTVIKCHDSGDPHKKVDIAVIGEGYTADEKDKFRLDLQRFTNIFFKYEPYASRKNLFNVYGILKPSEESGSDEPRAGIYKRTAVNSTFNSMGSERYLLTEEHHRLRDIASHVPYDALMIMVNHKRYGGGGIYNFFCTFTADTQYHEYIFIHEFGHSFSGLGDEYYTSSVAYNDFYPKGLEPLEANITALIDPSNLKWKSLMEKDIEIPTPWEKEKFDAMNSAWQRRRAEMNERIAKLKREGAESEKIRLAEADYDRADRDHSEKVDEYLKNSRFWGQVGAFEGAGYSARGLYRPMADCIMFTKGNKPFCRVCEDAVTRVIRYYTE